MLDSESVLVSNHRYEWNRLNLAATVLRPVIRGKFLYVANQKFWVKGVTYGTFRPDSKGNEYGTRNRVEKDFRSMVENGINCIRTYTVPPSWLLDAAQNAGLHVFIGLPWEQHITFLDESRRAQAIEDRIRRYVRQCAGHPAVLCYAIGNEIPASIVRWYGRKRIERFLQRLYYAVKQEDPQALVTYVNFPSTEYLRLPFLDIVAFNVYLESKEKLNSYLARLNNLAEDRPLLMAEIGLDSQRNGALTQAKVLDWQVRSMYEQGCCGGFVFSWTDEWYRGGYDIQDWKFGLTNRDRYPKPALEVVKAAFEEILGSKSHKWPMISVVVCSYNGEATIRDTLNALQQLDYARYEVIVINDGSTDRTKEIASEYDVKIITTENRGLSAARNTGYQAASGSIVAYIDDDAYPDPHWLRHLAIAFMENDYAAVGGPNLPPPDDPLIAQCIANSPGGPNHVLLTDTIAEHIPGCNMAFRKEALEAIAGFDPSFRIAGDDVDACWRLQETGGTIGFSHAAVVWHHRRGSLRSYWKQQKGYGRAEGMLAAKWPDKYNSIGHIVWGGRIYGNGKTLHLGTLRNRIYHGVWGSAPFQALYQKQDWGLLSVPLMPEWYLMIALLFALVCLGLTWSPLLISVPLLFVAVALPIAHAILSAVGAKFGNQPLGKWQHLKMIGLTAFLHLQQPFARLFGRLEYGLAPWRSKTNGTGFAKAPSKISIWQEHWKDPIDTMRGLLLFLRESGAFVLSGGDFDSWDLEVRGGFFGKSRLRMAVEEHGGGRQMVRFHLATAYSPFGFMIILLTALLSILTALDGVWGISVIFCVLLTLMLVRVMVESLHSKHLLFQAIKQIENEAFRFHHDR